ncbi:hypothetical protein BA896_000160 [Janthinobacterium lividum]|uniref:Bacteriophage tail tape measure N-terminal domain-containing protein n=1 Tax=Janthinobacterium lividum TaxID=29581 RepID=A0A1E8PN68_9BURK|nr:hypothetical protein BA896_000160 [Janthinobacterium lividum]
MTNTIGGATIELAVDSSGVESGLDRVDGAVKRTGRTLDSLRTQGGGALDGIGADGVEASKKVDSATRNMIGSIQRTTAAMESGSRTSAAYYEVLASQRGVNVEALRPYLQQLDAVAAKQKVAAAAIRETDPVMKQLGVSSGQTTAALRQMPAQLTDIFTSLAGGQNPLLVLIQQGGQIKDAFGGIGNTFKVLGGEVASFFSSTASASSAASSVVELGGALSDVAAAQAAVSGSLGRAGESLGDLADNANSATEAVANTRTALAGVAFPTAGVVAAVVAAASAVVGLAVAYYQGSKEASAYTNALILTGNAAGTTSDQLADAARAMRQNGTTQGAAAEALTALVSTGKVGAENLSRFASVAVQAQKSLGMSAASMAKDFADLGKTPLDAIESLNEKYHFLTLSTYEQINALKDQGRMQDAATVAQKAYADAIESRAKSTATSLGSLERAWNTVGGAAKKAWDYMLDIGREDTSSEKLAAAEAALEKARRARLTFVGSGTDGKVALQAAEKRVAALREEKDASEWNAKAKAEGVRLDEAGIVWAKEGDKYLTRQLQLERDIEASRNMGLAAGASDVEITQRAVEIRKKYSDIFSAGIDTQIEAVRRRALVEEESAKRSMVTLAADRGAGLAKSLLAEFKYADDVAKLDQEALARKKALLVAELALTAAKPNSKKEQAGLSGAIAEVDAQALSRTLQLKEEIRVLDIKDTKQAANNLADLADKRATDLQAIRAQLQAQKDANTLIGLSAAEAIKFNQSLVEEAAARKEVEAGILDTIIGRESEAAALRASATAMRALGAEQARGLTLSAGTDVAKAKELLDILVAVDNAAKQAAQGMTESFGRVGSAIGGLTTALTGYAVQQKTIAAQLASIKADPKSGADKIAQAELAATKASATAKVKSYADMATAAKGFFKENTAGYKVMEGAEKAFRAYEMAMAVESMVKKIFFKETEVAANLALNGSKLTGEAATTAASTGLAATEASAWGITAVVKAMASLPFPLNLAAGAATLAAVVAIGAKMVGGMSGGSGGGKSAADVQKVQGTGSVFGDSSAKSDSIRRSIEQLKANSDNMLPINQGMLTALQSIEASMAGLTNLVVRTPGLTDGTNMGIQTGTIAKSNGMSIASGAQIGSMIGGYIAGPLGIAIGAIGGAIIGGLKSIWGKTTQNIVDSGLQYGGSVRGLEGGKGFAQYASIDTKKSSWFGLSKSTSNSVQTQGLNDELSKQFGLIFTGLDKSLQAASVAMGGSAAEVTKVLDNLTLESTKVSLKGLTGTALTDALNSVISKSMDEIAQAAFPQFDDFRKVGEGYAETVMRLAGDYAKLDSILASSSTTFGATGIASIAARERLIELTGGIDKLASQSNSFIQGFLTQAEQLAPVQKYVTDQLAAMGLQSLTTRDQFKNYVLGLASSGALLVSGDITTRSQEQYAALLALSEAFAKTHAATEDLTKSEQAIADERRDWQQQLNELTKTEAQLLVMQRDGLAAVNRALFDQVQAAKAVVSANDALGKAYDREAAAAQTALDRSKSWVATLNGLNPSLALGSQSILTPQQKYDEARVQLEKTLAAANAGDTTARSKLDSVEQAFLAASQVVNASDARYAADYARVLAANDEALKWASAQVDVQQASLDALKAQVSGLITINDSVLTVAQAIANLQAAMGTATGLGVKFDGSHAGGLANVPFDGYAAELHRGEVVVDAPAAAAMRRYFGGAPSQGGGNIDALVAEIKLLRAEVAAGRADADKQTGAVVQATVESNASAAKTVVLGVEKSAKQSAWAAANEKEEAYD